MLKSLLISTSRGATAPCMVCSFLRTVSTAGLGPKPLTSSAGAPLSDLVIQFLTVASGNLPIASFTSCTHWEKEASFFGGGTTPLKVEILRASAWGLAANLWMSSIILANLASAVASPVWASWCQAPSSTLLLASETSSWVATLLSMVTFWPTHHSTAASESMWFSITADSFNSNTASHSLKSNTFKGASGLSFPIGLTMCWVMNIPAITSCANKAGERGAPWAPNTFKYRNWWAGAMPLDVNEAGGSLLDLVDLDLPYLYYCREW